MTEGMEGDEEKPPGEEASPAEEDKVWDTIKIQFQCLKCNICLVMVMKLPATTNNLIFYMLFLFLSGR